jgi:hypothetical protein
MAKTTGIYSDPIIAWPTWVVPLREMIGDLQRLNPHLGLVAIEEYLLHNGTERDVVEIVMPESPSVELVAGFTQRNYDWMPAAGGFRKGARRFERTTGGNLRIRPHTWELEEAGYGRFNWARQAVDNAREVIDQINRIAKSWFIFRQNNEIWEVDFGYMPHDHLDNVGKRTDEDYWRIVPVGTISYIDQYDLPIEEHYERAREIVKAGSEFAIVGDMQTRELRVFRVDGVQKSFEDIRMPEMPWFDVPVPERQP